MSCFERIKWFFHFSKWIYDITHLQSLVYVLQSIELKMSDSTTLNNFVEIANRIIDRGNHRSKHDLKFLEGLLQEISNDANIRKFLPRGNIGGGSGIGEAWTSAKMYFFLFYVLSCNDGKIDPFDFSEYNPRLQITADDIHQHGHNVGAIWRAMIFKNWQTKGIVSSDIAFNQGRVIALTPRGEKRNPLASSSSSIYNVPSTPRQHFRVQLASSSSSVVSTPLNTFPSSVGSTPLNTPRGHLCNAPPQQKSLVLEWFMAIKGPSFKTAMDEVCKDLDYQNDLLVQIYEVIKLQRNLFCEMILNNPQTQRLFFDKLSSCVLIQRTLKASPFFKSIEDVAFADNQIQIMFIEGLVFSFFQACRKPFTLGISKIEQNSDGDGFSISLFPQHLIDIYLENLPKNAPFHSTQMIGAA